MSISNQLSNEAFLIERCIANDRTAQKYLYDKYSGRMYALCLRYAVDADQAKDLLQEGFIKVFRHIDGYKSLGTLEAWMRRIFVTTCISHVQRKKVFSSITDTTEQVQEEGSITGFERLAMKDLQAMIQSLSDGYRTVFNLYAVEGYSHKEIAEMLQISVGTSKSQLARAKAVLQKGLEEKLEIG